MTQVSPAVQRFYEREQKTLELRHEFLPVQTTGPAITTDGKTLEVAANASSYEELSLAFEKGADGIGLFRTEMAFLQREHPPSEEEQFAIYAEAARVAAGRPVIIRTFDLGGDKTRLYLNLPAGRQSISGIPRRADLCRASRTAAGSIARHSARLGIWQYSGHGAHDFLSGRGAPVQRPRSRRRSRISRARESLFNQT